MAPSPDPALVNIGIVVVVVAFLLGIFKQVLGIINYFRAKPPVHEQYVKIDNCSQNRSALEKRLDAASRELDTLDESDRKGRSGIHRDVRDGEKRTSALESQYHALNQQMAQNSTLLTRILKSLGSVEGQLQRIKTD